jgi:hypothetical protein
MTDRERDILRRQGVAEGRHVVVQPSDGAAFVHDGAPVRIGLGGRERAVAEVGKRDIEPDDRFLRAAAIGSMTGGAGGPIDVFTRPRRRERALRGQPGRRAAGQQKTQHESFRGHPACLYQWKMRTG